MAKALRIDNNLRKLVLIYNEYKENGDRHELRLYKCPDDVCGVPVFAVYPAKFKPGRIKSPHPYFRAGQINPHNKKCKFYLEEEERLKPDFKRKPVKNAFNGEMGEIPVVFNRNRNRTKETAAATGSNKQPVAVKVSAGHNYGDNKGSTNKSTPSSQLLEKFAEVYEKAVQPEKLPIYIPGCRAKNYAEAFVPANCGIKAGKSAGLYIYKSLYKSHKEFKTGTALTLTDKADDGLPMQVWISNKINKPLAYYVMIIDSLKKAQENKTGKVYVCGEFVFSDRGIKHYSVELEDIEDIYISFSF